MGADMSTAKLRIAFATPEYVTEDYFDGGLANYLNRVSQALASLGHDVHVVTLSQQNEAEFEHEGVMVHRLALGRSWQTLNSLTRYSFADHHALVELQRSSLSQTKAAPPKRTV